MAQSLGAVRWRDMAWQIQVEELRLVFRDPQGPEATKASEA